MNKIKPNKPYPTFPLTAHPNGQWCKKIRGKIYFFGVWADPEAAHQKYLAEAADLHAGRQPRMSIVSGEGLTVKEICNEFLNWQKGKMDTGEIGPRWFEDCRTIITQFAEAVGKGRLVSDLRPDDFNTYRLRLAGRLGAHALTRNIVTVRGMFKYTYEVDLLDKAIKFGTGFSTPSAVQKRKEKSKRVMENGKNLFTKDELIRVLDKGNHFLKAATLLGINGGFGNTDCATLPISTINLDKGIIEYDRPKTGVQRVVPLWPETVEAIRIVLNDQHPRPENEIAERLVFLTPRGKPIIRQIIHAELEGKITKISNSDYLNVVFGDLLEELKIHRLGIGFYTLRHTFRTWADETHDQHAIHRIMGHAIPGMSGIYIEEIELDRLRAVTDHVRNKLFGKPHGESTNG